MPQDTQPLTAAAIRQLVALPVTPIVLAASKRNERIALAALRLLVERGIMARLVNREDAS